MSQFPQLPDEDDFLEVEQYKRKTRPESKKPIVPPKVQSVRPMPPKAPASAPRVISPEPRGTEPPPRQPPPSAPQTESLARTQITSRPPRTHQPVESPSVP